MKIKWFFLFIIFSNTALSKPIFKETPLLRSAYVAIFDLKLNEAQSLIDSSKLVDPNNYLVYQIENYIDFIRLFIGEDKILYDNLYPNKDHRLDILSKGDQSSPYFLFAKAEVKLQWAIIAGKFDKKIRAGREAYGAYKLLKKNTEIFPNFIHNKKTLSAIHAISESLPSWLRFILNVDGSIKLGTSEIKSVIDYCNNNHFLFKEESIAIYALILFHFENNKEKAWEVLTHSDWDPKESPIAAFLIANIAQKTGRNDQVISILSNKPNTKDRYPFYYLDYLLGKSKLNRLDQDANIYIQYFLDHFKGQHYIKEGYQKLAWYELVLNENYPSYKKFMLACQDNGQLIIGSDIQAQKEAEGNYVPEPNLLKARLYFDGGYYHKAYQILIRNSYKYMENKTFQLEFYYRLARVTEELKNYTDAIKYYAEVLNLGRDKPEYYACKSAYQMGRILETEKKFEQATHFYKECINLEPIEYKNEIHSKAKAGLDRISNQ